MIKTPFFPRQIALCESMHWKEWSGYYAVSSYLVLHDMEYFAFRNAAGLLDVTPLFKYRVRGKDAAAYLAQIMVKDITRLSVGRVTYLCWCNHEGKVVDDGTVMRRGEEDFFVTTADPCFSWFSRFLRGYDVSLEDVSEQVAAVALQGPTSRDILKQVCDADLDELKFFRTTSAQLDGFPVWISRTGYTGDLGYEIWVDNEHALTLWDALMAAGRNYAIRPAGLDALDVCRVEAGLILKNVDYYNALHVLSEDRKSSPYALSLGWTVSLIAHRSTGSRRSSGRRKTVRSGPSSGSTSTGRRPRRCMRATACRRKSAARRGGCRFRSTAMPVAKSRSAMRRAGRGRRFSRKTSRSPRSGRAMTSPAPRFSSR